MSELTLVVYSDYLCPWCHVADHRLRGVAAEFEGRVGLQWRSFLLRPVPDPGRNLEKFRRYTQSWQRPAAEEDAPEFRVWKTEHGPPSHSVPAHVVAKAAADLDADAFDDLHERLLHAYFVDNRDISDPDTLRDLWVRSGLAPDAFPRIDDPGLTERVLADHEEALRFGVNGVPAVRLVQAGLPDDDVAITGAHPRELYRRWIRRRLEAVGQEPPG